MRGIRGKYEVIYIICDDILSHSGRLLFTGNTCESETKKLLAGKRAGEVISQRLASGTFHARVLVDIYGYAHSDVGFSAG